MELQINCVQINRVRPVLKMELQLMEINKLDAQMKQRVTKLINISNSLLECGYSMAKLRTYLRGQ